MGIDAEELIIRPFQDVIDRGTDAVAAAAGAADDDSDLSARMTKAAQALLKEGERALKRLKPLWDGQVDKYGDIFRDAILQKESVDQKRQTIEELLYDFEDFAEPDTFSSEKFSELQAATKVFAMDVIDSIKRMKLEAPPLLPPPPPPVSAPAPVTARPAAIPSPAPSPSPVTAHPLGLPPPPPLPGNGASFPPLPPLPTGGPRVPRSPAGSQRAPKRASARSSAGQQPSPHASDSETLPSASNTKARRRRSPTDVAIGMGSNPPSREGSMLRDGPSPLGAYQQLPGDVEVIDHAERFLPRSVSVHHHEQRPESRGQPSPHGSWNTNFAALSSVNAGARTYQMHPMHVAQCGNFENPYNTPLSINTTAGALPDRARISAGSTEYSPVSTTSRPVWTNTYRGSNRFRTGTSSIRTTASRETFSSEQDMQHQPRLSSLTATSSIRSTAPSSIFDHSHLPSPTTTDPRASMLTTSRHSILMSPPLKSPHTSQPPLAPPEIPIRSRSAGAESEAPLPTPPASTHVPPAAVPSADPTLPPPTPSASAEELIKFEPVAHIPLEMTTTAESLAPSTTDVDDSLMFMEDILAEGRVGPRYNEDDIAPPEPVKPIDCLIGPTSTLQQMGGLCSGATTFRNEGWNALKHTAGYVNEGGVAGQQRMDFEVAILDIQTIQEPMMRCPGCKYSHEKKDLDNDMEKKAKAITKKHGVNFRLRLLYKSHINQNSTLQRQLTACYACIFCVHTGETTRDCDATVFRSAEDLAQHLSRHPQPLPEIPGVKVLYGKVTPDDPHAQDFDVHFPDSPMPVPMPENVVRAATGIASQDHFQLYTFKKLRKPSGYDGEMLQFLTGARIVGIAFPDKWEGKWCLGRHDGGFGAFPAKCIDLRPPVRDEIPLETSQSGMSVTTKWKWKPRRGSDVSERSVWLEFGKGDVISNVRCLYANHWCWAGTDKTGRFGVFPQSHLDMETMRRDDSLSVKGSKKSKTRGLFSRRPASSSGMSSHSGLTMTSSRS